LVALGAVLFWPDDALVVTPDKADKEMPTPADNSNFSQKLFDRSVYSLDLLIPVLDLRYGLMWVSNPDNPQLWHIVREFYWTLHQLLGWALVAVILAWLAGIIKTE
jgi:hypothetical protein